MNTVTGLNAYRDAYRAYLDARDAYRDAYRAYLDARDAYHAAYRAYLGATRDADLDVRDTYRAYYDADVIDAEPTDPERTDNE